LEISFLVKGMVIGLSIAAPVGPISLLCIRRSLAHGRRAGLASGMGAATADGIYGAVAAFGLTSVSGFLVVQQWWFGLIGGVLLVGLGAQILFSRPPTEGAGSKRVTLAGAYASTFVLTLSNPVTILMFAAIFAGLGIAAAADVGSAALLTAGVFLGSAMWWTILSAGVGASKSRLSPRALSWVNRAAGAVIAGFGIAAFARLL